jgi:hypothetical protein
LRFGESCRFVTAAAIITCDVIEQTDLTADGHCI